MEPALSPSSPPTGWPAAPLTASGKGGAEESVELVLNRNFCIINNVAVSSLKEDKSDV
jgi:hypothetical protein